MVKSLCRLLIQVNHVIVAIFMSQICLLTLFVKISEFTLQPTMTHQQKFITKLTTPPHIKQPQQLQLQQ